MISTLILSTAFCTTIPAAVDIEQVLNAIRQVESSGGKNNKDGDNGLAIGDYQIHKEYWKDATRILKVKWTYKDARDPIKARQAVKAYITHYQKTKKYPATAETYARLHNGGPEGPRKKATLTYWQKVKVELDKKGKEK